MCSHHNHASMSFADRYMLQILVLLAATLECMVAAFTKLDNSISNAPNGFIDPENMGLDTNKSYICASHTEI
jgi:hypothetical protein